MAHIHADDEGDGEREKEREGDLGKMKKLCCAETQDIQLDVLWPSITFWGEETNVSNIGGEKLLNLTSGLSWCVCVGVCVCGGEERLAMSVVSSVAGRLHSWVERCYLDTPVSKHLRTAVSCA